MMSEDGTCFISIMPRVSNVNVHTGYVHAPTGRKRLRQLAARAGSLASTQLCQARKEAKAKVSLGFNGDGLQ